jgi:hypothetical protein
MPAEDRNEKYHNEGQEDASEEKPYDPPYGTAPLIEQFLTDKDIEARKHYDEGWRNAKEQKGS